MSLLNRDPEIFSCKASVDLNACHSIPNPCCLNWRSFTRSIHFMFGKSFAVLPLVSLSVLLHWWVYDVLWGLPCGLWSLYYILLFCCYNKINKETEGKEEVVAKIETTTDELKPNSGEKPKTDNPEPSPSSEKEEPLFKSSLRMKIQPKIKVSWKELETNW